jgi:hypothetical protein
LSRGKSVHRCAENPLRKRKKEKEKENEKKNEDIPWSPNVPFFPSQ